MKRLSTIAFGALRRLRALVSRLADESIFLADQFPKHRIGKFSYGAMSVFEYGPSDGRLEIGNYCSFAADIRIFLGGEHRSDWISTYPFNALEPAFFHIEGHPCSKGDVLIGNDVWIGRAAVILSGVRIGNGAVVGAYSVVTKNVPDYAIVAGNPARVVRMRFSPETVARLQEIEWWNWPDERVRAAVPYLQSDRIDEFLQLVAESAL